MEVEIKLNVSASVAGGPDELYKRLAAIERLAGVPLGAPAQFEVRDLYYDTASGDLARAGAGLRLRLQNGSALVTLKVTRRQEAGLAVREEYEEPLTAERFECVLAPIRPLLGAEGVPFADFSRGETAGPLVPTLVVHTVRIARAVGDQAMLTLDRVEYPGLADQPYWDIEVEATGDTVGEPFLRAVERALQQEAGGQLLPASVSKLERGLRLRR